MARRIYTLDAVNQRLRTAQVGLVSVQWGDRQAFRAREGQAGFPFLILPAIARPRIQQHTDDNRIKGRAGLFQRIGGSCAAISD